jgi:hypothetical protein
MSWMQPARASAGCSSTARIGAPEMWAVTDFRQLTAAGIAAYRVARNRCNEDREHTRGGGFDVARGQTAHDPDRARTCAPRRGCAAGNPATRTATFGETGLSPRHGLWTAHSHRSVMSNPQSGTHSNPDVSAIRHQGSTCRWVTPTLFLQSPMWCESANAPWTCLRGAQVRVLDTTDRCTTCVHWAPR